MAGELQAQGLHSRDGSLTKHILDIIPENDNKKIGQAKETYDPYVGLSVLDWTRFGVGKGGEASCIQSCGSRMDKAFQENPHSLRMFLPDELVSNKLNAVFDHTGRDFQWDGFSNAQGSRVIEIFSEHCCQGFM